MAKERLNLVLTKETKKALAMYKLENDCKDYEEAIKKLLETAKK